MTEIQVVERIQKLLRLAERENTPKAEAELALEIANRMMLEYDIEQSTLTTSTTNTNKTTNARTNIPVNRTQNQDYIWPLVNTISHVTNTLYTYSNANLTVNFIGRSHHVQYAKILFNHLTHQLNTHMNQAWDNLTTKANYQNRKGRFRAPFLLGEAHKTSDRLRKYHDDLMAHQSQNTKSLQITFKDEAIDYIIANYPHLAELYTKTVVAPAKSTKSPRKPKNIDRDAYLRGYAKGDEVRLHTNEAIDVTQPQHLQHPRNIF